MLKLWRILNSLGNAVYAIGVLFGIVVFCMILVAFVPTFYAVLLAFCIATGLVLGIYGNVSRSRQIKRDAMEKELQDIASGHRSVDTK